jgi:pimeloyl-ACP methyl ester carboxylesterase
MAEAVCNGVRLYYETIGDGEPVLVIGGTSMPPMLFQLGLAPALVDAGYQAVLFASRGVEPSEAPSAPYTVAEMAADTAALIDNAGIGSCHVVGYSLGGFIAEELCYDRPDLVRDVVLMASAGRSTSFLRAYIQAEVDMAEALDPPVVSQVIRDSLLLVQPIATLQNDDTVDLMLAMMGAAPPWTNPGRLGQWSADLSWLNDVQRINRWPLLQQRCLTIAFEHDIAWPPERVLEAAEAMPNARFAMIADAAHGGLLTHGDEVSKTIISFLNEARATP